MSQQATQPGATELDANIDALFNQLEPTAAAAAPEPVASPVVEAVDPVMAAPVMPEEIVLPPTSSPASGDAVDPLLAEVSQEIEREAPSPAAVATPAPRESAASFESDMAFEAPSAEELQPEAAMPEPVPAPVPPPAARAPQPAGSSINIDRLDAALAANADNALAAAQEDLAAAPKPVAAKPAPAPVAAPKPAPAVVKHVEPEVVPELPETDAPAAHAASSHGHAHAPAFAGTEASGGAVAIPKPSFSHMLAGALQPLAALHERFGESTRQTIGYCAILTIFSASCAWGLVYFMKPKELKPATGEQPFIYNDTVPAHGVTAPPRHTEGKAAAHAEGGEGGGHGEAAKKDAHAKPSKKSESSGHGKEAAEKPKKAPTKAKKGAKAEAGGGGH